MYIPYNPNPEGKSTGDCVIRALTKALNKPWDQVYIELCVEGYILGDMPSSNSVWSAYLKHHGFIKNLIPNSCPDCYTVRDFANDNHNMFIYKGEIIMAYTPTNWKDGDIISAEKMNKLEQGVAEGGGGVLLVNVTEKSDGGGGSSTPVVNSASPMLTAPISSSTFTADKTYDEVDAAVKAGKMVYLVYDGVYIPLVLVSSEDDSSGGETK